MDIYDIQISQITDRYLEYINLMEQLDLDVASEFLVMAATLLHIKSQSILAASHRRWRTYNWGTKRNLSGNS